MPKNHDDQYNSRKALRIVLILIVSIFILSGILYYLNYSNIHISLNQLLEPFHSLTQNNSDPASSPEDSASPKKTPDSASSLNTADSALSEAEQNQPSLSQAPPTSSVQPQQAVLQIKRGNLPLPQNGLATFVAIDVGQGDSLLFVSPGGKVMMIDAGLPDSFKAINAYLTAAGITKIDVLVATHPHSDHIGSMKRILQRYEVDMIYMSRGISTTTYYTELLQEIKNQGKKVNIALGGAEIPFENNVKVKILAPNSNEYSSLNNFSVVLHITYGANSFLLMADAEIASIDEIRARFSDELKSDVIKVGHHGSSDSTTSKLLKAVSAKIAVISLATPNDYGHPHRETLELLKKNNCSVVRTDELGTIAVYSDGSKLSISAER